MPIAAGQITNSTEFLDRLAALLPLAGGAMTGPLVLGGDPLVPLGAATRQYVDAALSAVTAGAAQAGTLANAALPLAGSTMTGALILAGDPVVPLEAATRQYADAALASAVTLDSLAALLVSAPTVRPSSASVLWFDNGALSLTPAGVTLSLNGFWAPQPDPIRPAMPAALRSNVQPFFIRPDVLPRRGFWGSSQDPTRGRRGLSPSHGWSSYP